MVVVNIAKRLATAALTETDRLAWKLIYAGGAVGENWELDQIALEDHTVRHWCVQLLVLCSKRAVRVGERLEVLVERIALLLGIDIFDVLTPRVDPRLS